MTGGELVLILGGSLLAFWFVGKLFIKALKFLAIAAVGMAVVGIFFFGYLVVCYGAVLAAFAAWMILRHNGAREEGDLTTEGEGGQ